MRWSQSAGVLKDGTFGRFYAAHAVSAMGSSLNAVAVAFGVLQATGSATQLGLVVMASVIPMIVFVLAGGVWADRLPRQQIMITADLLRFGTQGIFGLLLLTGHAQLWSMMLLQVITGLATAFHKPAITGLAAAVAPPSRLQQANALTALSNNISYTAGPLVAGLLVATAGAGWAFVVDAVTFLVSAMLLKQLAVAAGTPRPKRNFAVELREGWQAVRARDWVWSSILCFMSFHLVTSMFFILGPTGMADKPNGALRWASVAAALAAGQLMGNALALRWKPAQPILASRLVEFLILPLLVLFAIGAPLPVLIVAAAVAGCAQTFPDALWFTALQQNIPDHTLSRVSSFDWLGSMILRPVGYTIAGAAVAGFGGVRGALLAGVAFLVVVLAAAAQVPGARRLRSVPDETPRADGGPVSEAAWRSSSK